MLNHTLIKRSLATAAIVAAAGFPASAQAMFISGGGGGSVPSTPAVKATAPSVSQTVSGFQWRDAGVGAAGATVLLGAGALGAGATRRRRRIAVR
jgi:hypothetical protein